MKVFVVGAGSWGTALANVLADNGNQVVIYGRNKDVVDEINSNHTNKKYFEAIVQFDKAIAINPQYFNAYYNKGSCLILTKEYSKAYQEYLNDIGLKILRNL